MIENVIVLCWRNSLLFFDNLSILSILQLLPACNTWADYLWAYFKVMVDQKVEQTLRDHLTLSRPLEPLPPNFDQKL